MIYFVQAGSNRGPVKIGFAKDPAKRVAALSTASPERLRLLCVIDGDPRHERRLHQRFAPERIRGEWFDPSGRLVRFIDDCRRAMERDTNASLWLMMQLREPRISAKDQRMFDRWEAERRAERLATPS